MKSENLKKKQHFISQSYLKRWGQKAGKGHKVYTFLGGKIHLKLTEEIAHERYFYEIHSINETEKAFLLKDASLVQTPHVGELFKNIINGCYIMGLAEKEGFSSDDKDSNLYKKNTIEDYYGITEDIVSHAYEKVILGKIDDVDINDYQNILRFALYQHGRTPKVREKVRKSAEAKLVGCGIRFDRWYTLSMLMTCERLFLSCVEKLYKITVIDNRTSINYITNDNPVVNMRGMDDDTIELFWPVSPKKAIVISPYTTSAAEARTIKERWLKDKIMPRYFVDSREEDNDERVSNMNRLAWDNKHRFAFAFEEGDLRKFI